MPGLAYCVVGRTLVIKANLLASQLGSLTGYNQTALFQLPEGYRTSVEISSPAFVRNSDGTKNQVYAFLSTTGYVGLFNWGPALTALEGTRFELVAPLV